ncbi:DUF5808 domain-containing protein [Lacticaseibacillus parakribbianus]|uniref:DUF5808 domain-containing protein n=1 Tax=Lacticaseibacillus parakribbianus TaxID=2970927 RepID=UPI0021CAED13|nr:DUF5808 domain-containing protein [Lacticaseibacillus parakribbianus]
MQAAGWVFGAVAVILWGSVVSAPWLSRPNTLFGVAFGTRDLRQDAGARAIRTQFAIAVTVVSAVVWGAAAAVNWRVGTPLGLTWSLLGGCVADLAAAFALLVRGFRQAQALRVAAGLPDTQRLTVDLTTLAHARPLPWWGALALVPLIVAPWLFSQSAVAAAANLAVGVVSGASYLGARFAGASVRQGPRGTALAVQSRNALLGFALSMGLLTQGYGWASVAWPRQATALLIAYTVAAALLLGGLIGAWLRHTQGPVQGPVRDDNAHWVLGLFYYAPQDSAVFVEKRLGVGLTLNMARPAAWVFLIGTLVLAGVIVVVAIQAEG